MKRVLSYLSATALLAGMLAVGGVATLAAGTTVGEDRIVLLDDCEGETSILTESGMDLLPITLESSTEAKSSGSKSVRIQHNGQLGGDPISEMAITFPETNRDLTDAKYVQFWVKNDSTQPVGFSWWRLNTVLCSPKSYLQKDGAWVEGRYFTNAAGDTAYTETDGTVWKKIWKDNPVHVIPAGYEGLVRLDLQGAGKTANTDKINFGIIAQADGKQTVYVDDISLVYAGVERHDAPTGLVGVAPTSDTNNDGKITGVTNAMEYRATGAETYTAVTGTEITGLAAGNYQVRMKATDGVLESGDVTVVVPAYVSPQAQDFLRMVNDFNTAAKAGEASAKEYPFLAGDAYDFASIPGKNSKGVKMTLKADTNNPLQKTLITTALGDLSNADYFQLYINWTGKQDLEAQAASNAALGTPQWYYQQKAEIPGWEDSEDGKFWKDWILVKGNTGSVTGDRCGEMQIYQDGKWITAKRAPGSTGYEGYMIPAGYKGYIRFVLSDAAKKANRKGGVMFQLKNAAEDLAGDFYFDDLMIGMTGVKAAAGFDVSFDEYVKGGASGGNNNTNPGTGAATGVAAAGLLAVLSAGVLVYRKRR